MQTIIIKKAQDEIKTKVGTVITAQSQEVNTLSRAKCFKVQVMTPFMSLSISGKYRIVCVQHPRVYFTQKHFF